jgi:uncharacterized protein (TIGR00255 family)
MTGFARQNGEIAIGKQNFGWGFELKSVNGKGLDVRVKVPGWLEGLSLPLKNLAGKYFSRGNIGVFLEVKASSEEKSLRINEALLEALATKAVSLYSNWSDQIAKPSVSELLAIKGVVEVDDEALGEEGQEALHGALLAGFEAACYDLQNDRRLEGEKIKEALLNLSGKMEKTVSDIAGKSDNLPQKAKEKLSQQVKGLTDMPISEDRLAQEIVLLATKADIQEEVDRLKAHLKTVGELLNSGGAVGRRLDFLCQELNREANTVCSKACDIELTNLGVEMKILIEQVREQVQNIE